MATTSPSRITSMDVVRGLAVIGIFFANVIAMALPEKAASYPTITGFDAPGDRLAWLFNWLFIDNRMRALFTILFGASLWLIAARARDKGHSPLRLHLPRLAILFLIGLAHFYFLWWGDILTLYAMVGLLALVALDWDRQSLLRAAIILLLTNALAMTALMGLAVPGPGEASIIPTAIAPTDLAREIAAHSGPLAHAAFIWAEERWTPLVNAAIFLLETLGLMLLGMALMASGFLAGSAAPATYRRWLLAIPLCLLAYLAAAAAIVTSGFDADRLLFLRVALGVSLEAPMALGYAALMILATQRGGWLVDRLAATGRAAFTNYLGATILMTPVIFGPSWGELSRGQAWLFAPLGGLLMLLWSKPWLERYRYGPFEWLWRSLARGELQEMRR
ncbi:DUF418 domain-containing protein [Sphingomicrobium aestuariivivum]|uniref:DUF418 domain-containing protein n=1 Tax=Sphingomicrobium aestuariivivum TaxID=1582356 RepID=UPI001FD7099A|nr:DUF418 domain-containing protein [Sphingomicrobium aestuariivivum]MCJ8190673.1 DUF418 domain-containing protein [Sphingomicrobium aestuariivivum]